MSPNVTIQTSTDPAAVEAVCSAYGLTPAEFHVLKERSAAAKATAYCPYSNFRVGATLLSAADLAEADGSKKYIDGANVENAAYPVGTCAERVALGTAVTSGVRRFKAIAVSTDISPPASPCGACRQFIREFCDLKMPIIMFDKNSDFIALRLEELLPLSFGPEHLHPRPGASS